MIFYILILLILLIFSTKRYDRLTSFIPHVIILGMITLKGEVGCDYWGYLQRYLNFDVENAFLKSKGEISWYFIEYLTHINNWGYQMYTVIAGVLGISLLFKAQQKIKYLGFLVFIFQMILVQLGLSGLRQFVAVCILIYATSIYVFGDQKHFLKFVILIFIAATFHISVLAMGFILPFLVRLKKIHIFLIVLLCLYGLTSSIMTDTIEKYDTRYLEGSSASAGAWLRFFITLVIIKIGLKKENKNLYYLGLTVAIVGIALGIVNSIALHRFNYYFLPIVCLILIRNYKLGLVKPNAMKFVYAISVGYFIIWFSFSEYTKCFIPYNFYFF
ncbi:EpsG family protein [Salinimicrobium sp. CAU 1759]